MTLKFTETLPENKDNDNLNSLSSITEYQKNIIANIIKEGKEKEIYNKILEKYIENHSSEGADFMVENYIYTSFKYITEGFIGKNISEINFDNEVIDNIFNFIEYVRSQYIDGKGHAYDLFTKKFGGEINIEDFRKPLNENILFRGILTIDFHSNNNLFIGIKKFEEIFGITIKYDDIRNMSINELMLFHVGIFDESIQNIKDKYGNKIKSVSDFIEIKNNEIIDNL